MMKLGMARGVVEPELLLSPELLLLSDFLLLSGELLSSAFFLPLELSGVLGLDIVAVCMGSYWRIRYGEDLFALRMVSLSKRFVVRAKLDLVEKCEKSRRVAKCEKKTRVNETVKARV